MKKWVRNKKLWIAAGGIVVVAAGALIVHHHMMIYSNGISYVLGGADGPTAVFVAGKFPWDSSKEDASVYADRDGKNGAEAPAESVPGPEAEAAGQDRLKKDALSTGESNLSTLPLDMTMEAVSFVDGILTLEIDNHSGYTMTYGDDYVLQKWENDDWTDMVPEQEYGWHDIAHEIEDLTTDTVTCDLTFFGELPAGRYKLIKSEMEAVFELNPVQE